MKLFFIISFLFMSLTVSAQKNNSLLISKTYMAKIGSICEETPDDNPCAGKTVYLVLKFNKKKVEITEVYISSCDKESISYKLEYKWELVPKDEIKIHYKVEEVEYKSIENMKLKIIDDKIFGYKKDWNTTLVKYVFNETN